MEPLLTCQDLTKSYGLKRALDNIQLTLPRGRVIGLLGPNGSGKTTLIKLICGLLEPTAGYLRINGLQPGPETKAMVSYLPDRTYFHKGMKVKNVLSLFRSYYADFDNARALDMLQRLGIDETMRLGSMSKGTLEKVQLIAVMSRQAQLYCLDEPIGGVDPAARDYILHTIITNYNPEASVLLSTHLIADIESVLDDAIFIQNGQIKIFAPVADIRQREGKSIDALFREVYRC